MVKKWVKKLLPPRTRLELRLAFWQLRGWYYAGSAVRCPLCQGTFRQFLPFGKPLRAQAMCPQCNTVERHRLLWFYLQEELGIQKTPRKVLHMAPEPIIQKKLRALPHLTYLSADLESPVAMEHVDLQQLPYPAASFDLILCSHVLGHVPDDQQALRELGRVLRPGGLLLLQDHVTEKLQATEEIPASLTAQERMVLYGQPDRCRNYGPDLKTRVEDAGMSFEALDYCPNLPEAELKRLGLHYREKLFLCRPNLPAHAAS